MRKSIRDESIEGPESSSNGCVLAATLAKDHAHPVPGSVEKCDKKEELLYSSYSSLVTGDIYGLGTGSAGSQFRIDENEQSPGLKKQNVDSQCVTNSQIQVLRLRGGAGEKENPEVDNWQGRPHTCIISFHCFCLQVHLFMWTNNHF